MADVELESLIFCYRESDDLLVSVRGAKPLRQANGGLDLVILAYATAVAYNIRNGSETKRFQL